MLSQLRTFPFVVPPHWSRRTRTAPLWNQPFPVSPDLLAPLGQPEGFCFAFLEPSKDTKCVPLFACGRYAQCLFATKRDMHLSRPQCSRGRNGPCFISFPQEQTCPTHSSLHILLVRHARIYITQPRPPVFLAHTLAGLLPASLVCCDIPFSLRPRRKPSQLSQLNASMWLAGTSTSCNNRMPACGWLLHLPGYISNTK